MKLRAEVTLTAGQAKAVTIQTLSGLLPPEISLEALWPGAQTPDSRAADAISIELAAAAVLRHLLTPGVFPAARPGVFHD